MKRKTKVLGVLGVLGSLSLAGGNTVVQQIVKDQWQTIGPVIYAIWDWLVGVYEWVVHPVVLPLWLVVVVPVALITVIVLLALFARETVGDLSQVAAKLNPTLPPLNESAHKVMEAIVAHTGQVDGLSLKNVARAAGLSQLMCDGALDVLRGWNLIHIGYGMWNTPVTLTEAGRAYILAPGSPLSSLAV
ncbi:hypothetical protein [Pseudomonas laurylsulfatiphila]|uniref:hypothetical protein n=1 Tax=Pseudomonas laurylsulfatiphila TaxID=2011015 RepID=UPI003D1D9B60